MAYYEHVFMVRQDASNTQVEALTEQFKSVVQENGGTIAKTEYWGLKPIAYRIRKNRKAHYTLMNLDAPHAAVAEMERQMKINEDIIRFLTLRVDELEEGPSAMMRVRRDDRDSRDGRGRGPRGDRDGGGFRGGDRDGGGFRGGRDRDDRPRPPRADAGGGESGPRGRSEGE